MLDKKIGKSIWSKIELQVGCQASKDQVVYGEQFGEWLGERFGEGLSERLGEGSHERLVSWLGKDEV